ncbi:hypothetical protein [Rhodopseudomonas palustris]|uniref:hypothetical protein n=1 Tax=Rhodopseudomonas palustris TaxID=1076 RepID=UPI0021F2559B|nr:hypothetical protein [Rhodopseudomonas palustris]UYO55188.1 hypothetical protein KQX61_07235 [Rhodopseudomonas palustris]
MMSNDMIARPRAPSDDSNPPPDVLLGERAGAVLGIRYDRIDSERLAPFVDERLDCRVRGLVFEAVGMLDGTGIVLTTNAQAYSAAVKIDLIMATIGKRPLFGDLTSDLRYRADVDPNGLAFEVSK